MRGIRVEYKIEHHHHRTSNQIIIIDNEVYFSLPFSSHRYSNEGQKKTKFNTNVNFQFPSIERASME